MLSSFLAVTRIIDSHMLLGSKSYFTGNIVMDGDWHDNLFHCGQDCYFDDMEIHFVSKWLSGGGRLHVGDNVKFYYQDMEDYYYADITYTYFEGVNMLDFKTIEIVSSAQVHLVSLILPNIDNMICSDSSVYFYHDTDVIDTMYFPRTCTLKSALSETVVIEVSNVTTSDFIDSDVYVIDQFVELEVSDIFSVYRNYISGGYNAKLVIKDGAHFEFVRDTTNDGIFSIGSGSGNKPEFHIYGTALFNSSVNSDYFDISWIFYTHSTANVSFISGTTLRTYEKSYIDGEMYFDDVSTWEIRNNAWIYGELHIEQLSVYSETFLYGELNMPYVAGKKLYLYHNFHVRAAHKIVPGKPELIPDKTGSIVELGDVYISQPANTGYRLDFEGQYFEFEHQVQFVRGQIFATNGLRFKDDLILSGAYHTHFYVVGECIFDKLVDAASTHYTYLYGPTTYTVMHKFHVTSSSHVYLYEDVILNVTELATFKFNGGATTYMYLRSNSGYYNAEFINYGMFLHEGSSGYYFQTYYRNYNLTRLTSSGFMGMYDAYFSGMVDIKSSSQLVLEQNGDYIFENLDLRVESSSCYWYLANGVLTIRGVFTLDGSIDNRGGTVIWDDDVEFLWQTDVTSVKITSGTVELPDLGDFVWQRVEISGGTFVISHDVKIAEMISTGGTVQFKNDSMLTITENYRHSGNVLTTKGNGIFNVNASISCEIHYSFYFKDTTIFQVSGFMKWIYGNWHMYDSSKFVISPTGYLQTKRTADHHWLKEAGTDDRLVQVFGTVHHNGTNNYHLYSYVFFKLEESGTLISDGKGASYHFYLYDFELLGRVEVTSVGYLFLLRGIVAGDVHIGGFVLHIYHC
ncbi:hypothetical protein PCE1_000377 [Barthelona sp. PCE]